MSLLAILLLVLIGVLLVLLEIFVVPGITVAGIGGLALLIASVYFAYDSFGTTTGHAVLLGIVLLVIILFTLAFKSSTWDRIMLKTQIDSDTDTHKKDVFKVGEKGIAVTRLAPMGRVEVHGIEIEAQSTGIYIDPETEIEIVKVLKNKLIVKPKTN